MGPPRKRHTCKVTHSHAAAHESDTDGIRVGEYKVILQLVSVLSHGKLAKRLTDRAIDQMQDVQNLRKAIYEYVPSILASCPGPAR